MDEVTQAQAQSQFKALQKVVDGLKKKNYTGFVFFNISLTRQPQVRVVTQAHVHVSFLQGEVLW